jgi:hypothetical protein
MVKQLAGYVTSRKSMDASSKQLLENALQNQQDQVRLVLAAIGSHKMQGISDILRAIDFCKNKILEPGYLETIGDDPEEMRRHLTLLMKIQEYDNEYLRMMAGGEPKKQGFSEDPKNQYNIFFGGGSSATAGEAVLPDDMDQAARKRVMNVLEKALQMAEGNIPTPPAASERVTDVIDVEFKTSDGDRDDSVQERTGQVDTADSAGVESGGHDVPPDSTEGDEVSS